ncbi:MAG: hypothetical protein MMC33_005182 [Icmadophila ericetorum]|nr:hypothetical protein [Icmadophila ericetorum]
MRIFVTGAAGFIGSAVVKDLLEHGYQVLGLARSDVSAEAISKAGAEVHRGDLENLESLRSGAKASDGVIHLGFIHDFSNYAGAVAVDRAAIAAMGEAMAGTGNPLIIASGTLGKIVPRGEIATEDTEPERNSPLSERAKSADLVKQLSKEKGIRGMVVQLTPTVHGPGDPQLIPRMIDMARKTGIVTYIGDGSNRWPAVHLDDAAVLFRLALEKGTPGATYNAVAEQGVLIRDIMNVIGQRLKLPVEEKSTQEGQAAMGLLSVFFGVDNPTSSEKTRKALGWTPTKPGLLEDLEANYFDD